MSLGRRTARHDTARVQKIAVDSTLWWEYKPEQRVMTIDGIPGVVTAVLDGPHPGSEAYVVRLDDNMGGGQYTAGQLSSAATTTASHEHEATGLHLATEDYPELGNILHERPPIERVEHLAAKVASADPFEIRHVEHDTGGTKFPTKVETTAHHPDTGSQVGHARYFPPKRKGGPISIDEVKGQKPGAASAMLNDIEGRHPGSKTVFLNEVKRNNNNPDVTGHAADNAGKPSDWDTHYPNVKDTVHRGLSVRLPPYSSRSVNSSTSTKEQHLDELHRAIGTSSAGTHWTEDEHAARLFANNAVSDHRTDIPVVLHAAKPVRKDIETRQTQLYRGGVFPYGDGHSKENEVPIRKGRDVSVTGMSWKPDAPHPDADENGWIHHTYDEPKSHTAAKDSTVYLRFGDWDKKTERSHNNVTGHTEDGVSVYDLDHHGHPKDPDPDFSRGHEHDESCDDDCDMDWGNQDYGNDTREEMDGRVHRAERARYNGVDHPTTRAHLVRGEMVGIGHDGEPLLNKVKRVGDWIDHKHLFFPGAQPHRLARGPYDEGYEHPKGLPKQSAKKAVDWDTVGSHYPHIYGDPEVHGEAADGADGPGIGEAANYLAHEHAGNHGAENTSVHDLTFHPEHVDPQHIDYARHGLDDHRVAQAHAGYKKDGGKGIPPLVLVHRHGVYQVADGHHRAEAAHAAGVKGVPALVAYSPHPDEPFSDGEVAPFHGAEPHAGNQHTAVAQAPTGEPMDQDLPPCSYCGNPSLAISGDNGRNVQATCGTCQATMSSWGGQFTPELIGDPSNHPSQQPDKDSGGVGGTGNTVGPQPVRQMNDADHSASLHTAEHLDLYHRTTPERAEAIRNGAPMHSLENHGDTFWSNRRDGQNEGYGEGVVHIRIPEHHAQIDDEFPDGEEHYRVHPRHIKPEHIVREGSLNFLAGLDTETLFQFTAAWSDVRAKAKRLRSEGSVRITVASSDGVGGEVKGDNNVYETVLSYAPGSYKVAYWTCGCKWAAYAWGRSPAYKRFEGRMCSHALAMQFEAQARGMFGKTVQPDETRPKWLRQRTPVVIQHERDTGKDLTRRTVPPGNMRRTFEGSLAGTLDEPPIVHLARYDLFEGVESVEVMRSLMDGGFDHRTAKRVLRRAMATSDGRCPDCGSAVSLHSARCPHCGAELSTPDSGDMHLAAMRTVRCGACGSEQPENGRQGTMECGSCGTPLHGADTFDEADADKPLTPWKVTASRVPCGECEGAGTVEHEVEATDEEMENPHHVPQTWHETCDACDGTGRYDPSKDEPEPEEDPHHKKVREHLEKPLSGAPHGVNCPPFCPVQQRLTDAQRQKIRSDWRAKQGSASLLGMPESPLLVTQSTAHQAPAGASGFDLQGLGRVEVSSGASALPSVVGRWGTPRSDVVGEVLDGQVIQPHAQPMQASLSPHGGAQGVPVVARVVDDELGWDFTHGQQPHEAMQVVVFPLVDGPSVSIATPGSGPHVATVAGYEHDFAKQAKGKQVVPTVAGVALKARDTGRILMLQRGLHDDGDPAKGTWEMPGGHIEPEDQTSLHAALREFEEEVGQKFPQGGSVQHVWTSPNGIYQGHLIVIPEESQIQFQDGRIVPNPDDPGGDHHEQAAWWEPEHARKNPALREECKSAPWKEIGKAGASQKTAAAWDLLEELDQGHTPPLHSESENPGSTGFATAQDPPEFDHPTINTTLYGGAWGSLHDAPEPALPSTDGADEDFDNPAMWAVEQHPATHDQITDAPLSPQQFTGSVDDIVARFQATAGAQAINAGGTPGGAGPSDGDIASAAKAFLDKTALKQFNFQEQQELITEGSLDNVMARNSDRLDIADTHYHAIDAALAAEEAVAHPDDLFA